MNFYKLEQHFSKEGKCDVGYYQTNSLDKQSRQTV